MPVKNLQGQKFGRLTVIEQDTEHKGAAAYWKCQCECGNIKSIRGSNLTSKNKPTRSCGCLNKESHSKDIDTTSQIGKQYGRLTVIQRDMTKPIGHGHSSYWICKCECGNIISVSLQSLTTGATQSCGCLKKEILSKKNFVDLTGQRFGLLVAISKTEKQNNNGSWMWKCQCDCGNIKLIPSSSLRSGRTISCGCHSSSKGEILIQQILTENNIRFVKEFTFPDLKGHTGQYLRFDFAILDDNNQPVRLIEFDGEQHSRPSSYYYSKRLIECDQMKNNYCLNHNIPLIRIPYADIDNISLEMIMRGK